jgi:hypothetical protein
MNPNQIFTLQPFALPLRNLQQIIIERELSPNESDGNVRRMATVEGNPITAPQRIFFKTCDALEQMAPNPKA